MAKIQGIKKQIALVRQIQHVTHAMKTLSAVRLRLGKETVEQVRHFVENLKKNLETIELYMPSLVFPEDRILLLAIFSDKGLVGGFNKNVADAVFRFVELKGLPRVKIAILGKQGERELRELQKNVVLVSSLSLHHVPHYAGVRDLAFRIMKMREEGRYTYLYIAFTRYFSITSRALQIVQVFPPQLHTKLLPIQDRKKLEVEHLLFGDLISLRRTLEQQYLVGMLYQTVMESFVSEHAARFTIMDAATTHSKDIIESLTIFYHKKRQERITQELNEVTSAAEVL
ncbi:MAG: FoF1 ATP synthase subunit gamma [Atribacterota bacterium]